MARRVRFGVLGCGMIGSLHARAMGRLDSVELVAVADAIPQYAHAFADLHGISACDSFEELLARPDIDAITLCTPSGMHAEQGILAAQAGKHVLCEKPMDLFVERVDALIAACRTAGVTLGGIFQNRFPPLMQRVKAALDGGLIGELVFAEASCLWHRPQSYYDSSAWRGTWAIDGGALANQSIHTIDRLLWLTGMQPEVIGAYCPTLQREMEAEDLGLALLRFPNGAGGVIQGTTLADPGFPMTVTLCGTRASLTVEANSAITLRGADLPADLQDQPIGSTGGAHDPMAIPDEDHAANIDEFARAVLDGRDPTINGEEARKAVQLLNDIYRAAGVGPWAAVARTP